MNAAHLREELHQYECFGIPAHVRVEADGSAAPSPPGWERRHWILREASLLGAEAMPSPPLTAAVVLHLTR